MTFKTSQKYCGVITVANIFSFVKSTSNDHQPSQFIGIEKENIMNSNEQKENIFTQ